MQSNGVVDIRKKAVRRDLTEEVIFEQRDLKVEKKSHVKFEEVSSTQ